jgi:lysozyme family protein
MRENWDKAFDEVIKYEGGYVNNPRDPGGPTNLGITQATLSRWLGRAATVAEVKALTREKVKPIYKRYFWDVIKGDALPGGVDFATYDFAVNSGPSRAARYLQSVVGVKQDGKIGPAHHRGRKPLLRPGRRQEAGRQAARLPDGTQDLAHIR